jgi:hypothetical protein
MGRLARALVSILVALVLSPPAWSRPMEGKLGLGGQLDSGILGRTLSVKYWVSELGLQGLFGFSTVKSTATEPGAREYRFGLRMLYALTRTRLTNLNVGVGLSTFVRDSSFEGRNPLMLDVVVAPEFHLGDNFAVSGQVSFSIELGSEPLGFVQAAQFGAAFHFYFDL